MRRKGTYIQVARADLKEHDLVFTIDVLIVNYLSPGELTRL